ncbi:MAG: GNAT family N-acetyltransferase [Rubrobacteraceae bacterium]
MNGADLNRIQALRSVVNWSADPRAFDLLRGMRDARWTVAEARDGALVGMVGAVPLGSVGILCHLAVHDGYRGFGLGARLTSWAVAYLRSRGVGVVRLYSTLQAEKIYRSAGFEPTIPRTVYRLDEIVEKTPVYNGGYIVETLTTGDLPEVYGLDLWSSRAERSALILATLRLHSGRGLVARDSSGRIKGYLIRSSTPRAVSIGPFLAENLDVARLLLNRALESCATPVEVTVTTPDDTAAHHLFEEYGFVGRKDRMQMELGTSPVNQGAGLEHYGTTPYLAT